MLLIASVSYLSTASLKIVHGQKQFSTVLLWRVCHGKLEVLDNFKAPHFNPFTINVTISKKKKKKRVKEQLTIQHLTDKINVEEIKFSIAAFQCHPSICLLQL